MSTSAAIAAFGTLIKKVTTTIAEVISLSTPEVTLNMQEATSHDSPSGWDEFIPTVKSGGTVTLEFNWIPGNATHQALLTDFGAGTMATYNIHYPDAGLAVQSFSAYVERVKFGGGDPKAKLTGSATLRVTGPVSIAY